MSKYGLDVHLYLYTRELTVITSCLGSDKLLIGQRTTIEQRRTTLDSPHAPGPEHGTSRHMQTTFPVRACSVPLRSRTPLTASPFLPHRRLCSSVTKRFSIIPCDEEVAHERELAIDLQCRHACLRLSPQWLSLPHPSCVSAPCQDR